MNNYINNSFDEKYSELTKMLIYKKLNPPDIKYSSTFKINGIIHKMKLDLHGIGAQYEQFTYNSTNNKLSKLIHYHKWYDTKTTRLSHYPIKRINKKRNENNKISRKETKEFNGLMETCKEEKDVVKSKEMLFGIIENINIYLSNKI